MTEPTRNYQTIETSAIEGLDDIFEVRELDASRDANRLNVGSSVREQDVDVVRLLSVDEAAEKLGLSVRAVQKRLKKGTLRGRKQKTDRGERWLIEVRELDASQDANPLDDGSFVREQDANQRNDNPFAAPESRADQLPEASKSEERDDLIKEMQSKIEALTWRNGYLESQLENHREQLKLLTDSQSKRALWGRFWSWFVGK